MTLRRGFKSEANSIARSTRSELGLLFEAKLDPWILAEHLAIPLIPLSQIRADAPHAVHYFTKVSQSEFSAVTVFKGTKRVIVYNDSHSIGRQASDIAHELAHGLLLHVPGPALNDYGCRNWDEEMEEEADWLCGALLISEEAALKIVRSRLTSEAAATHYGTSKKMVEWRVGITGARRRIDRMERRYAGKRT